LTFLGLIAFGLPIKSDFSQFQSFFSKDSIEEKRKGDKEIISLLPKVVPFGVRDWRGNNIPALKIAL
jgi:hypothetical protein